MGLEPDQSAGAAGGAVQSGLLIRLLKHFSNYSLGSLLVTVASLISFPILTRVFSVSEYGVLALVNSTLGFLVGCGKLGVQFSIVRFYAEVETGQRTNDKVEFFTTVLLSMTGIGATIALAAAMLFGLMPSSWWRGSQAQYLIALAAPLVLIRTVDSGVLNLIRAQHRSRFYGFYTAIRKYVGLAFVIGVLLLVSRSLRGFFVATIVAEGAALLYVVALFVRQGLFRWGAYSGRLLRAMLGFGMPLFASSVIGLLLGVASRYLVNFMLGAAPLGVFSAASNLGDYMVGMFSMSFAIAVEPMYFRQWEQEGPEKTRRFLSQAFKYYLMLAFPMLAGMTAVGPGLLRFLASSSYTASPALMFLLVAALLVNGVFPIFCAGVNLKKMTTVVMVSSLTSSLTAIVMTWLALPHWGIEGAAAAGLVASIQYSVTTAYYGRKVLSVPVPWLDMARFAAVAACMYALVLQVHLPSNAETLIGQISLGAAFYALIILLLDADMRAIVRRGLRVLRSVPKA